MGGGSKITRDIGSACSTSAGYSTSSGSTLTIRLLSQWMSPPLRNWSTIWSPSERMARTDIARPDWKKTSSARAGAAAVINRQVVQRVSAQRIGLQLYGLLGLNVSPEYTDPEFAAVGIFQLSNGCRHERLVDRDSHFHRLARAELCSCELYLSQLAGAVGEIKGVDHLVADAQFDMLRGAKALHGLIALQIEHDVAHRVAERERRRLLRPLPLETGRLLRHLGLVPPILEDDVEVVRLRMQVELRDLILALAACRPRQR